MGPGPSGASGPTAAVAASHGVEARPGHVARPSLTAMSPPRSSPPARRGLVAVAAAVALASAGCLTAQEPRPEPPTPTVGVARARTMTVPLMARPNATTLALQSVSLRARVRGFLEKVDFQEGSDVPAGKLLFVIEEEPYRVALRSAQARRSEAEAALKKAEQSRGREVAAAQVAVQQALVALARIEEGRQRILFGRNAAAQQDVDRAVAERQRQEAQLEAAQASSEQARSDYDVGILAARAELEAAQAAVRDAEINLGYCRMSTPIDGRIGEAFVKAGNLVGPLSGSADYTELATVAQLDPMGIDIQVSSRHLPRATALIPKGLTATVIRPGLPEGEQVHPYPARMVFLDNRIDPTTSTFLVRAEVPNPEKTLLPGEYVQLDVEVGSLPGAVVVPEEAVMEAQGGEQVYTVDDQGTVGVARVKATQTYRGLRVIESGLRPGQAVVVEGIQLVRPGMKVKAEEVSRGAAEGAEGRAEGAAAPADGPDRPAGDEPANRRE